MFLNQLFALHFATLKYLFVFVIPYVYGYASEDMLEKGRAEYQLLQERVHLPQYGNCWKQALAYVDEGCQKLSEETQSDIALHLTNCFLEMSGHETYNCELNKKPNLRGICINSMSDRAFNVYTEFYTHTQNMCWFLHGQLWQETLSENTQRMGRQLEQSAKNQEELLNAQKESLELQEKLLKHGRLLEDVLSSVYLATKTHNDILALISKRIGHLQAWLIGEVSWFDSVLFYFFTSVLVMFMTSTKRTHSARFPIMTILGMSVISERLLCNFVDLKNTPLFNISFYTYVWFIRYLFIFLSIAIFLVCLFTFKDYILEHNILLTKIHQQNSDISNILSSLSPSKHSKHNVSFEDETKNGFIGHKKNIELNKSLQELQKNSVSNHSLKNDIELETTPSSHVNKVSGNSNGSLKYNLRSRQGTPVLKI